MNTDAENMYDMIVEAVVWMNGGNDAVLML